MDFMEEINALGARSKRLAENLTTEEATKTALILPFIQLLGFDIFNPTEVIPEYQAEAGVKKDQRVDYALLKDGQPIILIEAKAYNDELMPVHADQLKRYFPFVQTAKIGVLTNGHHFKFYTDLEQDNVMDDAPYMEFDIENPVPELVWKLQELKKERFDDAQAIKIAEQLKYTGQFKALLAKMAEQPDEDFVRLFAKRVWSGMVNQNVKDKLTPLLKDAFKQFIEDKITARLQKAAAADELDETTPATTATPEEQDSVPEDSIQTTEAERLGFTIVQAIASSVIDPSRIALRDTKTYCGVLLDDNKNRTILRMYFNSLSNLKIDLRGPYGDEKPFKIEKINDLYKYSQQILEIINFYDNKVNDSTDESSE